MAAIGVAMWWSPQPWTLTNDTGNGFLGQDRARLSRVAERTHSRVERPALGWLPADRRLLGRRAVSAPPARVPRDDRRPAPLLRRRARPARGPARRGLRHARARARLRRAAQAFAGVLSVSDAGAALSLRSSTSPPSPHRRGGRVAFVGAERVCRPTPRRRDWALGWIALAAQVHAGMPEQATYCALAVMGWMLVRGGGIGPTRSVAAPGPARDRWRVRVRAAAPPDDRLSAVHASRRHHRRRGARARSR
jgi:hypothetical protein